nr:MAG TPA: Mor transcription activator family [Caudoviricetes sp.]
MIEAWTSELTPSMLPDGLCREIAEQIGTDNLLKLSMLIGGSTFYLPRKERLLRPLRDIKIREEYNGYNTAELSRKYDVSQRWVQQIINRDTDSFVSE